MCGGGKGERSLKREREVGNMCTIIISKLLGSVVAPWRPLLAQTTRLPCPDQQAQTQAQAQAWVRMQPPLQLRASWQPTSAVQHARSFWRPSRPWAATWTCVACRPCPRGDAAWRLVNPQGGGREREREKRETERVSSGKVAATTSRSPFAIAAEGCAPDLYVHKCCY